MPANPSTAEMGERHEAYLAKINGGSQHRASGAVWFEPADGSNGHDDLLAFAWDGKSTLGKSIPITRDMIAKIRDQSLGRRPQIGLRFYGDPNLDDVDEDWVAVPGDNWEEVLGAARMWHMLLGFLLEDPEYARLRSSDDETVLDAILGLIALGAGSDGSAREALAEAHRALSEAGRQLARRDGRIEELEALQAQSAGPGIQPGLTGMVPRLPWAVIRMLTMGRLGSAGDSAAAVTEYAADGTARNYEIKEVRVQHSMAGRPQVYAENVRMRKADVYDASGRLIVRVCDDDSSIEVG